MDGANGDSDHSMTWEDFFGSTTDLTPTLIGIYDSLLEPAKSLRPEANRLETAKDARNDPPVKEALEIKEVNISKIDINPTMITGGVKLPIANFNKESLYPIRTKCEKDGASVDVDKCNISDNTINKTHRTFKETRQASEASFDNLSPNVKRMISSASETTTLKFQKKSLNIGRTSMRKCNIPLVGATSKISQSGLEILTSVDIYDQPCAIKTLTKSKSEETAPPKPVLLKPEFKIDDEQTYDVPTNNQPAIYDVPVNNKTAFESLSLPYIDQSIEFSITSNDREFDTKLSSKDSSPIKPKTPVESPSKAPKVNEGTNSLHRKDFVNKSESPTKLLSKAVPYPETVGSIGNLKCEKEVIRLNPPVVEVSRPLSMSSIASSSSTSSSGVQNKGGVNSAYLASIESLDDHSDADMTSANGSNHFMHNTGSMTASVSEERNSEDKTCTQQDDLSGLSQLERVCAEIIQTENVYVEDLRQVVEGYLHVWRRDMKFSEEQLSELFNNIEGIYTFNRSLCEELNTCRLDATSIARCLVNNTSGFSVYTSYCTGYPRTMERLAALASEPHSAREFRERQTELGHLLPLASYLLKPVQRILKYHLLLQNVVKQCASPETEYALLKMTGIAQHIDDMKRRHEHAVRVQEIQSLLYGWSGPDLTTYGELCAEGTFRVFGAKAMRHAFLFDKMLLVTKNREDGILAYKSHIMCNNMMLVESIAGAPLSFHVIPWDAPRAQLTLQARSPRHKREWTLLLKRVILENYNAVIPSHARQLVMELGQNKTDDDMLAEKSHNLITQASMRKQLSAPEYLEKRKLERDRRKSFENGIRGRLKKANRKYTIPNSRTESHECDCNQVSVEKGTDYTCEYCYVDLCTDCEIELGKVKRDAKCNCRHDDNELGGKCAECDRSLHYIDAGSAERLERKPLSCKCSDFKSSQESFGKEFGCTLTKTRGYHSTDNIISYTDNSKSKEDLSDNNSLINVRHIPKTCLKCAKIKENIAVTDSVTTLHTRKSRCDDGDKHRLDSFRSKSKDDPQRSKLTKIGTWRRKSEPGLQQNIIGVISKKSHDSNEKPEIRGNEKIEFECKNCGSNKITRKPKVCDNSLISDPELDSKKHGLKPMIEIRMYNTKNIPKKISRIKKNRAKGRLVTDTTAKFYADFSTDVSTENILHISESNDSLNVDKPKDIQTQVPEKISKDEDIDEETYKKLIEKTDSFKKNELEKVKYLNKQKVINESSETEDKLIEADIDSKKDDFVESYEETEQPLEQIISQLLMQNREFQKMIKKQQLRNSAQRRHQRLLKSYSNPEQTVLARSLESIRLKSRYERQTSENADTDKNDEEDNTTTSSKTDLNEELDDDHIYETLRIDIKDDENLHNLNSKSKAIQHVPRPKRLPSPPVIHNDVIKATKYIGPDSDYVYLSFDKLNQIQNPEGIYDVPVRSPEKVPHMATVDYYVTMEHKGPIAKDIENENIYDTLVEVVRRKKELPGDVPTDYLPMNADPQSPNTPEIWLSRQKEHFNVSRDRKSGSLPRSFQVITSSPEENLTSFKCKPNSKTYLNRDGKVMSTDRPFTIASDQSEISYDDMSDGDLLKFNQSKTGETDFDQNISQSTLELEEEIDRCYKNKFEDINLDKNKNENVTVSQPNLNISTTSSCEVLPTVQSDDTKSNDNVIHPEHKIYKPTSNVLSLKNVLNRFKYRSPPKNNEDGEMNANDQSSPDNTKSDLKSPTNEKRSALNPRSYSKNLLQRFRSIIGDESADDNQNKTDTKSVTSEDVQNNVIKNSIKVIVTSTETSPTMATIVYPANNDILSKSVCEQNTTRTESQNEKNNLEVLSISCDNINQKPNRPTYEKSVSMVTNVSSLTGSPLKLNHSPYHSLVKLPIYMQGSKHLGARIAQSDYVDPSTLVNEKTTTLKKVNVLINKNSVRPDSLFSNSSFVTSSSEGVYQEPQNKVNINQNEVEQIPVESTLHTISDENYYEKSFEKIEQVTDEDVFRDSAVYSDQEESGETKDILTKDVEVINTNVSTESSNTETTEQINNETTTKITITSNKGTRIDAINSIKKSEIVKPKVAPPVPAKPKINQITTTNFQNKTVTKTLSKTSIESSSSESMNMKTIKRNVNYKQPINRSESAYVRDKPNIDDKLVKSDISKDAKTPKDNIDDKIKSHGNIQIKRLSFERASLDSAIRKTKPTADIKKSLEQSKSSKSVLERRMEIEQMSISQVKSNQNIKRPIQASKPKSITTKVANFERSVSDTSVKDKPVSYSNNDQNIPNRNSVEQRPEIETEKSSWVKQVVNKFQ